MNRLRAYTTQSRALSTEDFAALKAALMGSPLVGRSTLAGPFRASRGFAAIFTEAGRVTLESRFPELKPFFKSVLGPPSLRALTPWYRRVDLQVNAWYLNVLLVSSGGAIERHVDATLRNVCENQEILPALVSILYVNTPKTGRGGELRLWKGTSPAGIVVPRERRLVHFRGDLAHDVAPYSDAEGAHRISLVVEQYALTAHDLAKVPPFQLESRAGFEAFLELHATRPSGAAFEVEKK